MTREDIDNIISIICPNDEDFEKPIISPAYLKKELEALALEQQPCDVFDEYGNYKYPSDVKLTEPNTATSMPCEDAISREDALMCLTGEIKETDAIETIIAQFGRRIKKLPPVNPQPKWIPVSEGLPEEGQWVMVTFDGKIAVCIAHDNDGTLREATSLVLKNATEIWLYPESEWGDGYAAWMPLPEPYRVESEDKGCTKKR